MKKIGKLVLVSFIIAVMTNCVPKSEQRKDEGWVPLFDGKTTNGWRGYGMQTFPEKGWVIEDGGVLHVLGSGMGEAGGGGDIITTKKV